MRTTDGLGDYGLDLEVHLTLSLSKGEVASIERELD